MRTRQEIFNLAWNGLKAQGFERSLHPLGGCVYRGENGRKCAIGHCIPDERYSRDMEGPLVSGGALEAADIDSTDTSFARELQRCHDYSDDAADMESALRSFAAEYSLTVPD